jgi:hypothetical protein
MRVLQGRSPNPNGRLAVEEATRDWSLERQLDMLFVFSSTGQDPDAVASALAERFPGTPTVGCTTAGEQLGDQHYNGHLVVAGLASPRIRWATTLVPDLASFGEAQARDVTDGLLGALGIAREDVDPQKQFCLTFIDGLSCKEEVVSSLMADALEGLPFLGGSAGDDLKFQRTHVFHGGRAWSGAAVFALADSEAPFEIIKHQHYTTTPKSLVITRADVPARRVYEMDGHPALEAYAAALGLRVAEVTGDVTFMHPLTFVCNGEIYVRSIQRVEPDGSIVFYCGIEEGMVLSLGGHEEMKRALSRDVVALRRRMEGADFLLTCNCILRALEASKLQQHEALGDMLRGFGGSVIGFDTYGEQLNGLHINQTLVAVAIRDGERAPAAPAPAVSA